MQSCSTTCSLASVAAATRVDNRTCRACKPTACKPVGCHAHQVDARRVSLRDASSAFQLPNVTSRQGKLRGRRKSGIGRRPAGAGTGRMGRLGQSANDPRQCSTPSSGRPRDSGDLPLRSSPWARDLDFVYCRDGNHRGLLLILTQAKWGRARGESLSTLLSTLKLLVIVVFRPKSRDRVRARPLEIRPTFSPGGSSDRDQVIESSRSPLVVVRLPILAAAVSAIRIVHGLVRFAARSMV
jgi:hypothetical protein